MIKKDGERGNRTETLRWFLNHNGHVNNAQKVNEWMAAVGRALDAETAHKNHLRAYTARRTLEVMG